MLGKSFLPKSLFGRALLILVLPTVLIQLVVAYVFFDRHWDTVTRYMSNALAGEMGFFVDQLKIVSPANRPETVRNFKKATGIDVYFDPLSAMNSGKSLETGDFPMFQEKLRAVLDEPVSVRKIEKTGTIEVRILLANETLRLQTTIKRLESPTTTIFLSWMLGASILFLLIAILFLRNQIRPIRRLAEAADSFGRGIDMPGFRPHGAAEVRMAARAFVVMRERIKRQIRTRTDMLSGISHDLRTPLTRMKLQLAMLKNDAAQELQNDVKQMEHMIEEYLDFARGEGTEDAVRVNLRELVADVVRDYERLNADVTFAGGAPDIDMDLRVSGFRRMLHNLIDNALRYGKCCELALVKSVNYCEIYIDDEGPGIPEDKREDVFKPFNRLELSRNIKTGGVGLGLTIARDIVLAHGGAISLETSPKGGLRVILRLPL